MAATIEELLEDERFGISWPSWPSRSAGADRKACSPIPRAIAGRLRAQVAGQHPRRLDGGEVIDHCRRRPTCPDDVYYAITSVADPKRRPCVERAARHAAPSAGARSPTSSTSMTLVLASADQVEVYPVPVTRTPRRARVDAGGCAVIMVDDAARRSTRRPRADILEDGRRRHRRHACSRQVPRACALFAYADGQSRDGDPRLAGDRLGSRARSKIAVLAVVPMPIVASMGARNAGGRTDGGAGVPPPPPSSPPLCCAFHRHEARWRISTGIYLLRPPSGRRASVGRYEDRRPSVSALHDQESTLPPSAGTLISLSSQKFGVDPGVVDGALDDGHRRNGFLAVPGDWRLFRRHQRANRGRAAPRRRCAGQDGVAGEVAQGYAARPPALCDIPD